MTDQVFIRPYESGDEEAWDAFVSQAWNSTFLHSRRFLSYHGDRFHDASVIISDSDGATLGLLPAAVSPDDALAVVSHPGATFGGLVHAGGLRGESCVTAFEELRAHYAARGFASLDYRAVPHMYHVVPAQDDLYALFRVGAKRYRADLASTIDLAQPLRLDPNRRRYAARAGRLGLDVVEGEPALIAFWPVLTSSLRTRHNAAPVHSLDEITELRRRFPDEIIARCVLSDSEAIAGAVLFKTTTAVHVQYSTANETGRKTGALTALFLGAIDEARDSGHRFFSLGTSNEDEGQTLNLDLHHFKSSFGAGGVVHERYRLNF